MYVVCASDENGQVCPEVEQFSLSCSQKEEADRKAKEEKERQEKEREERLKKEEEERNERKKVGCHRRERERERSRSGLWREAKRLGGFCASARRYLNLFVLLQRLEMIMKRVKTDTPDSSPKVRPAGNQSSIS